LELIPISGGSGDDKSAGKCRAPDWRESFHRIFREPLNKGFLEQKITKETKGTGECICWQQKGRPKAPLMMNDLASSDYARRRRRMT
jgi:hypothetical protein